jgi:hypothetical protein
MAMGDGSKIFENRFEPETGSGIEIFRHRDIEIFNNEFHIQASPPSCEYNDNLSTNAIRMADYGAAVGSSEGCLGNRVYNNKFFITGRKYVKYPDFIPVANAFFYSASAGDNEIFGNDIVIDQKDPGSNAVACAFYIGNSKGGRIYNNHIRSNATPVWVASSYGRAENTELRGNTIEKTQNTTFNFKPIRMGSYEQADFLAFGTEFRSNEFPGFDFAIDATNQHHVYSVYWTLSIKLRDKSGKLLPGKEIKVLDRNGKEVAGRMTDNHGCVQVELLEYDADFDARKYSAPYTVIAGKKKVGIGLTKNTVVEIIM